MASSTEEPVVLFEGVSRRFGRAAAVDDVSLTIRRGDIYGLLGLNGAGKSTALRMMIGLLRPSAGRISVLGSPVPAEYRAVSGRIGAMIEAPAFYPHLSGRTNLILLDRLLGSGGNGRSPDEALEATGLSGAGAMAARKYSMGMLQRLYLAQALLGDPELLILDEPTSNLDPSGIVEVREIVRGLNRERGTTILLSSHQLSEVEGLCNRVAILHEGRKLVEADVDGLFAGEETWIEIKIDRADEAAEFLNGLGECSEVEVDAGAGGLLVKTERERLARINTMLVEAGFSISEFKERKPTLEDYFQQRIAEHRAANEEKVA